MKKFYTLLTAAAVASSAMALSPKDFKSLQLANSNLPEAVSYQQIQAPVNTPDGMQRVINTSDGGTEWAELLSIAEPLVLVRTSQDGTQTPVPFEEYPYYRMILACQPMTQGDDTMIQFLITWPSYGALDDDCWDFETEDGQQIAVRVNVDKCKAKYGDKAMKAMSYDDFVAAWNSTTIYMYPFFERRPQIAFNGAINWKGATVYPMFAAIQNDQYVLTNATSIDWAEFDAETSDVEMSFNIPYSGQAPNQSAGQNGNLAGVASFQLKGAATALGFAPIAWDTIGQVHIFNAGRQTQDDMYGVNYDVAFNPLNYYYLAMSDASYGYQGYDQNQKLVFGYGDDTLPMNSSGTVGPPSFRFADGADDNFAYIAGALWAPENSETPFGLWKMAESKYTVNAAGTGIESYDMAPMAYNLVEYLNCAVGSQDGLHGAYGGYGLSAVPGESYIGIGDKTKGLNFSVAFNLTNGYPIVGSYQGDFYFHPTPGKWTSDIQEISAVGNVDADAISAASSVQTIESNSPVVSKTFYNFQGQRLSAEPEHGMYIIRAVKADGSVKTTKVAR